MQLNHTLINLMFARREAFQHMEIDMAMENLWFQKRNGKALSISWTMTSEAIIVNINWKSFSMHFSGENY